MPYSSTSLKKKKFLKKYAVLGIIGTAARLAGVTRRQVYNWLESSKAESERSESAKKFNREFEEARQDACDVVEKELTRRAVEGVKKPVFYEGKVCGHIREYSDTLLIVLAKALMPNKYRERHEITGPGGGPVKSELSIIVRDKEAAELLKQAAERTVRETHGDEDHPGI